MNERIKELRKRLGLTQEEFAARIGIKRNTVATYEMGRNEPIPAIISAMVRTYGVDEEWLRNGTGEMFGPDNRTGLQRLSVEHDLGSEDIAMIEAFLSLSKAERESVIKYAKKVADACEAAKEKEKAASRAQEKKDAYSEYVDSYESSGGRSSSSDGSESNQIGGAS